MNDLQATPRGTRLRRLLLALAGGGLALLAIPVVALAVTFGGLEPSTDGTELPGGARLVNSAFVNAYVLPVGDGKVALIDCGRDVEGKAIKAELARRGLDENAVQAIFITHGHQDHIGGCRSFPKARVYAFPEEQAVVEGLEAAKGPVPRLKGPAPRGATKVTDPLTDGQTVHVGGLAVRAFLIPGHTGGSAAYLANGVLYLGDSAAIERGGQLRRAAWIFSDDQEESIQSVRRLARRLAHEGLDIQALACGHSGPATNASPLFALQGS